MKIFKRLFRSAKHVYDIPDEYQNSFYLSNASLFQIVNYFVHKSYEVAFPELVEKVKSLKPSYTDIQAKTKIREHIKGLEYCNHFIDMHIPIKRSNGEFTVVRGMRAYHGIPNNHVALGGFRMYEDLKRHTAQGFSILSTYRYACYGLDLAGAHGGLKINSVVYDPEDMKELLHAYVRNITNYYGIVDIIEPDLYAGRQEMSYMNEIADNSSVLIMGKPDSEGGIPNYESVGSKATVNILQMFLNNDYICQKINLGGSLKDKTYIIQGLGKTAMQIMKIMSALGAVCVGVRDHKSTVYDTAGIPVKALLKHYKKYGTILNFSPKAKEIDADQIFTELCDVLILASGECAISCHIADHLKAKIIVEACNGPITPTADKILNAKCKVIIPSVLAGGGHSLLSYLEHLMRSKNIQDRSKINAEIISVFDEIVRDTTLGVWKVEEELNLNMNYRMAAYIKGIRKIFDKLISNEIFIAEKQQRVLNMQ